jgi:hypothetical protein
MVMTDPINEYPWVLLEARDDHSPHLSRKLRLLGYEVFVCHGPTTHRECTLLSAGTCPLVEGADAVVDALGIDGTMGEIAAAEAREGTPCVVVGREDEVAAIDGTLVPLGVPVTIDNLSNALHLALNRR